MDKQNIGAFIAQKRKEHNLTQEQLAEMLGVSNKTVSKWETGKNMPDYSVVEQLCKILDISVSELLSGKEKDSDESSFANNEELALLKYKVEQLEKRKEVKIETNKTVTEGVSFGCVIAAVISYVQWRSIGWAIFHGLLGWVYVIYYLIKY